MMTAETNIIPAKEGLRLYSLGEKAVTVEFDDAIGDDILQRVTSFNRLIRALPFRGMVTTVPAYATVTVFFDPSEVIKADDLTGSDCFEKVSAYLNRLQHMPHATGNEPEKEIIIPVHYGGEMGPDLEAVARMHHLTIEEVIHLHSSAVYKVYMIGFVPGFAYLGGLPEILFSPRKAIPRDRVAAGSVGIAGKQTGIYPIGIPGGWQIIGQTPLQLFSAERQPPALLNSGNVVKFHPVSLSDFRSFIQP